MAPSSDSSSSDSPECLPPVTDASPLIFLTQGGYLPLLHLAGEKVLVPGPVAGEILRRGVEDVTAHLLEETPWLETVEPPPVPAEIQTWDLGPGESAVLAYARAHPGREVIIDDRAGRRCAAALGVPTRGTLGLVLKAKQAGEIAAAPPGHGASSQEWNVPVKEGAERRARARGRMKAVLIASRHTPQRAPIR